MVAGASALGDPELGDAEAVGDRNAQDVDRRVGGAGGDRGPAHQGGQPVVGLDRQDTAGGAGAVGRGEGEEADVGPHVPHDGAGRHQLGSQLEEQRVGCGEIPFPQLERGVRRDEQGMPAVLRGQAPPHDAAAAELLEECPQRSHQWTAEPCRVPRTSARRWATRSQPAALK